MKSLRIEKYCHLGLCVREETGGMGGAAWEGCNGRVCLGMMIGRLMAESSIGYDGVGVDGIGGECGGIGEDRVDVTWWEMAQE